MYGGYRCTSCIRTYLNTVIDVLRAIKHGDGESSHARERFLNSFRLKIIKHAQYIPGFPQFIPLFYSLDVCIRAGREHPFYPRVVQGQT